MQLLHPDGPVIHSLAAGGNGVWRVHPASLAVSAQLRSRGEPDAQAWELMLKYRDGGVLQVVADQAQVQVPALRAAVGSLDPAPTMPGSHGEMMPPASSRSRQVRIVRSDSPV